MTIAGTEPGAAGTRGLGVVLRDPLPWPALSQVVQTAEETGYDAVFVPEIAGREAFSTLTGFALCTGRVRLGTGVITVRSRGPATAAMEAATVQDISGGRLILGLGAGAATPGTGEAGRAGSILAAVRRYVRVVREILSGRTVGPDDLSDAPEFTLALDPGVPPPIWLGALGDRMIRLAGEIADGVLLNWCTPQRVAKAAGLVRESAERAGRDPRSITVAVYVRACLGAETAVALDAMRPVAGQYASFPHYRRQFERMGLEQEARAAAAAFAAGRPDEVPDGFVRALSVLGGRREALAGFDAYRQAGADLVLSYPVPALDPYSSLLGTILAAAPSPAVER